MRVALKHIKPQPETGWVITPTMVASTVAVIRLNKDGRPIERRNNVKCPYTVGEHVYIKEKFHIGIYSPGLSTYVRFTDGMTIECTVPNNANVMLPGKHSSLHLPAWAARTVIEIKDIRAQRVQDISEDDAKAEGVEKCEGLRIYPDTKEYEEVCDYRMGFTFLWDSIHGEGAWERNDWVWIYLFRRVER